jgi:hypothetical protein
MSTEPRTIEVLSPIALPPRQATSGWHPLNELRGARVVIVNNHWTSMDQLSRMLTERLLAEYQVASVNQVGLPTSAAPPRGLLEGAAEGADLAIVGLAN